jgi:hypothetical protein
MREKSLKIKIGNKLPQTISVTFIMLKEKMDHRKIRQLSEWKTFLDCHQV